METSGSVPRENKFEEGKEQPNDNHPIRNREFTKRIYKSLFSIFLEERTLVEDSSGSKNEQLELRPNSILLSSNNKQLILETSGSIPRENKFEEGQEQPNDNHPTRNRELTERNDKSSSSRKQHFEKRKHVEDSSDSENEQFESLLMCPWLVEMHVALKGIEKKTRIEFLGPPPVKQYTSIDQGWFRNLSKRGSNIDSESSIIKSSLEDILKKKVPVPKPVPPPHSPPVAPM
ncbi:uncharacterized protein [Magallana gigas]|uniref:uncharacterized protein n=1 Tax=Magallana gigas TaxID=29159 RepID=UPI00333FFF44